MTNSVRRITARLLQKEWGVKVRHALYHHEGTWYHTLEQFPAALFDPNGYVIFETIEEYRTSSFLRHNAHLKVKGGIRQIPGYILRNSSSPTPTASDIKAPPKRIPTTVYRVLRDTLLAQRVKLKFGYRCQLCGHTLLLPDGTAYAEAHHVKPLGAPHYGPDIEENILCVCPNHHAALDYRAITLKAAAIVGLHPLAAEFIDYHNSRIPTGPGR